MKKSHMSIIAIVIILVAAVAVAYYITLPPPPPAEISEFLESLPDYYPDNYADIVEAARDEGTLVLYSTNLGDYIEETVRLFKEDVPFVNVEYVRLSAFKLIERYRSELAAGAPTADVIWTSDVTTNWRLGSDPKFYTTYASPEAPYYPQEVQLGGAFVHGIYAQVISYNRDNLPPELVPRGYRHLVQLIQDNPDVFKGKIGGYDALRTSGGYTHMFVWHQTVGNETWDWLKTFGENDPTTFASVGDGVTMLNSGELDLLWSGARFVISMKIEEGYPLDYIWPEEGVLCHQLAILITKNPAHPNAAKLFYDWYISKEAQIAMSDAFDMPTFREDITPDEMVRPFTCISGLKEMVGEDKILFCTPDMIEISVNEIVHEYYVEKWRQYVYGE